MGKSAKEVWEIIKEVNTAITILFSSGVSSMIAYFLDRFLNLSLSHTIIIGLFLFIVLLHILIWIKASKLVQLKESSYEVLSYWDTKDSLIAKASKNLSGELFPKTILHKNGEIKEIPHPMTNHPSNRQKNCGENPTENEKTKNETK